MTRSRQVVDREQLKWSCVQARSGAGIDLVTDENGLVPVVCTPSGGSHIVRVELPPTWAQDLPDRELIAAIARAR